MTSSKSEHYRQLARDLRVMAQSIPAGENRSALLEMAEEWDRLAAQQERATDLWGGEHDADDFEVLGLLSSVAVGIVIMLLLL